MDDVLVNLHVVGGFHQGVEHHAQFVLGRGDLVVVLVHLEAHFLADGNHFGAEIGNGVDRRDREVAALDARTVTDVAFSEDFTRNVRSFFGVDFVEGAVHLNVEADVVEHEELGLGAEVGGIADTGGSHIGKSLFGNRTRIALVVLAG